MASDRGQNGIQLLLSAEQEAQQIINVARAKQEAEQDVAAFRVQMEADFQQKLEESRGYSGANVKQLEEETEVKIAHLKTEVARISHDVVKMILRQVTIVKH